MNAEGRVQNEECGQARELLASLVTYCVTAGPPWCYRGWPTKLIAQYLAFHGQQVPPTVAWVERMGDLCGVGVMWRTSERRIRESLLKGENVFEWKGNDPEGDAVFFADFICTQPGALASLIAAFAQRFPEWRGLKAFTFRFGRVVRLDGTHFEERFFGRGNIRDAVESVPTNRLKLKL